MKIWKSIKLLWNNDITGFYNLMTSSWACQVQRNQTWQVILSQMHISCSDWCEICVLMHFVRRDEDWHQRKISTVVICMLFPSLYLHAISLIVFLVKYYSQIALRMLQQRVSQLVRWGLQKFILDQNLAGLCWGQP